MCDLAQKLVWILLVQQLPNQNLDFAPRLLLGKYAIGESRGFLLHSGLMGQVSFRIFSCCYLTAKSYLPHCPYYQSLVSTKHKFSQNNRLVRVIECPPLRLETPQEWGQVSPTIKKIKIKSKSRPPKNGVRSVIQ